MKSFSAETMDNFQSVTQILLLPLSDLDQNSTNFTQSFILNKSWYIPYFDLI